MHSHPPLIKAELTQLCPTQSSVGYYEVELKRKQWAQQGKKDRKILIADHVFPAIIGPEGRYYIVDHHHLGLALLQEKVEYVWLMILNDFSFLDKVIFWRVMEFHQWAHPYDQNGERIDYLYLPDNLAGLKNDPYRSLAGQLRHAGGFAKDTAPFNEFLWADYLRLHIDKKLIQKEFGTALEEAIALAAMPTARYLPGWVGVVAL